MSAPLCPCDRGQPENCHAAFGDERGPRCFCCEARPARPCPADGIHYCARCARAGCWQQGLHEPAACAEDDLHVTLKGFDLMAADDRQSIASLEALWPADAAISWEQAYRAARERAQRPGHDQGEGREVAFLEGMLASLRTV